MKQLFDDVSVSCSKITTRAYSTSFSLGIKFLDRKIHNAIYAIYGFVRFADEIVDTFHDYDKEKLLCEFEKDTWEAIDGRISMNPIINSYQWVVNKYNIEPALTAQFFKSMTVDLKQRAHTEASYQEYILGSAEVVGLMCLRVFTDHNDALYEELKPFAMRLGAAFQKVNFLRDIKADHELLGRTYFPGLNFHTFSPREKDKIQMEIEADFDAALVGIKKLPAPSRRGVYLAYYYYKKLFLMIKKTPAERIMDARIRIPDGKKIVFMCQSVIRHGLNIL